MDKQIEKFIEELKDEFKSQASYNSKYFHLAQTGRLAVIPTSLQYPSSFKLRTDKYAEWRYEVKSYIQSAYGKYDIKEIIELLDMLEIDETNADRLVGLLTALAKQKIPNSTKPISTQGVFISHSSKDIYFVNKVSDFFEKIGIAKSDIFCSSIEGQGVKNGERIEETVREKLISSKLLFYVITKNFLDSNYCVQELGAGWILRDNRINGKKVFLLKIDDVKPDDIKGFINSDFKYSELTQDSLMGLIDDVSEVFGIPDRKATANNALCKLLLEQTKSFVETAVQQAEMNDEEKTRVLKEKLIKSINKLTPLEKSIIAQIYFTPEKCIDLVFNDGVTAQLEEKLYIRRLTAMSSMGFNFPYGLQPWIAEYIDNTPSFRATLKKIYNKQNSSTYGY